MNHNEASTSKKRSYEDDVVADDIVDGDEMENETPFKRPNYQPNNKHASMMDNSKRPNKAMKTSGQQNSMATDNDQINGSTEKNSMAQFGNILEAVKISNNQTNEEIEDFRNLSTINETLGEIVTINSNEDVLTKLEEDMAAEIPLILHNENQRKSWSILTALKIPPNAQSSVNHDAISNCFTTLTKIWEDLKSKVESATVTEEDEIKLHIAASKYFKCLLSLVSNIKPKHLRTILEARNFVFFDTTSVNIKHLIKKSFNFRINESFDQNEQHNRKNPLFKIDGFGMVVCRTKEVKQKNRSMIIYDVHEECQTYLGYLFYETFVQRIPRYKNSLSKTVFFNTVTRQNVAIINGLNRSVMDQTAAIEKDVQLAHVTINDAFLQPSKNKGQMLLVVTLYINYLLKAED